MAAGKVLSGRVQHACWHFFGATMHIAVFFDSTRTTLQNLGVMHSTQHYFTTSLEPSHYTAALQIALTARPLERVVLTPPPPVGRPCVQTGWTPLLIAPGMGHTEVAGLLLGVGAAVEAANEVRPRKQGRASHWAIGIQQSGLLCRTAVTRHSLHPVWQFHIVDHSSDMGLGSSLGALHIHTAQVCNSLVHRVSISDD
jgi:hypothetical protein